MVIARLSIMVSMLLLTALGVVNSDGYAEERLPVPPADDITKAEMLVRGLHKADYAKLKFSDRVALASKLLEEAKGTRDPAPRYVLLRDARTSAAKAANAPLAMVAAEELANVFEVGQGKSRAAVAEFILSAASTPTLALSASEVLIAAADAARNEDDWASAVYLANAAEMASRRAQSVVQSTLAQSKVKEMETMRGWAEKVKDDLETLKTTPDDPAANLSVGRFHCLIKRDWEVGIPMLAKGMDAKWKDCAEKELKAGKGTGEDQLAAADAWYELAKEAEAAARFPLQMRALHWYTSSTATLAGIDRTRAEKRMAELQVLASARSDRMQSWLANHKAIADGKIKKWGFAKQTFKSAKDFEEIPKDGAILIGFFYAANKNGKVAPDSIQPIYLAPSGEVRGKVYGLPTNNDVPQVTKAKTGYAVGAIQIRSHYSAMTSFQPIYMRITEKGLNPSDRYEGPAVGNAGTADVIVGGDGNFIIGLQFKYNAQEAVRGLSVITLTTLEPNTVLVDPKKKDPKKK
ncbi:MAG: hypothetical protein K8T89_00990 [Planctomycetes bacterium]|nr:hypothetical protein [Planctomycetota bacterium]